MKVAIRSVLDDLLKEKSGLIHAFSPRNFSREDGTTGELNFGSPGDETVFLRHKKWLLRSIGIASDGVFRINQVHGDQVYVLDDPLISEGRVAKVSADAIVTGLVNKPIAVLTADCIPVVIYDPRCRATGVVHAGRKGTSLNILGKTLRTMEQVFGCRPQDILVGMGPGIGLCCYEVDASCIVPLQKNYLGWNRFVEQTSPEKYKLDLFAANLEDARSFGVPREQISLTPFCTSCDVGRFFSYRKEGKTGRMMSLAMLRPL